MLSNQIFNNNANNIAVAEIIAKSVPKWIHSIRIENNEINICIFSHSILDFFYYLKNHTQTNYSSCMDITAIDHISGSNKLLKDTGRFEVVYNLLSIQYNARIRISTFIDELTPIDSIIPIYSSAGWYERETWDMFGIFFTNHPDLRRILTDYGFEGHPLRKDFPLSGYVEVRYDDSEKRVITESIQISQDFRYFDFSNPWTLQ